ncbi:MAG: SDR family oxidoreductase [Myxococcota bacterium]
MDHWSGRVAVITGAGSGLGAALARNLGRRGCDLALTDVAADRLKEVADDMRRLGRTVTCHGFDVSDRAGWADCVEEVSRTHGGAQVVVNNAGVSWLGDFADSVLDDVEWLMRVNLMGVIYGCHAFLPLLRAESRAHLVNISSILGIIGLPGNGAYCASKHAVRSLSEVLSMELADTGIQVSWVHPGAVDTRIVADGRSGDDDERRGNAISMLAGGLTPERAAEIVVRGLERGRSRILVGADAQWISRLHEFLPVSYRWFVKGHRSPTASGKRRSA